MKKSFLLLLAVLSYGLPRAQAQRLEGLPGEQPQSPVVRRPGRAPLEARLLLPEAARSVVVRRYTRASFYTWVPGTNQWAPPTISTVTYDSKGNLAQSVVTDSATQRPSSRSTYAHNAASQLTSMLFESWTGSAWQNSSQTLYTYDGKGRTTELLSQLWNGTTWVNSRRTQYGYDAKGNLTSYATQNWTNNAWATTSGFQIAYTYDAQGRITEEVESGWNTASMAYVPLYRYQITYTGTSTAYASYVYQMWTNNAWVNMERYDGFVYDTQGRLTYYESQTWTGTAWQLSSRYSTTYAANGSYVELYEQLVGTTWVNAYRFSQNYDAAGNYIGYTDEQWLNSAWQLTSGSRNINTYNSTNDLVRTLTQYVDATSHQFVNSSKAYYSNFLSITLAARQPAALLARTQLYPNPTARTATLELTGLREQPAMPVEVLNVLGQPMLTLTGRAHQGVLRQPLDLSALPAGLYSVRVQAAEGTVVKRLLRE